MISLKAQAARPDQILIAKVMDATDREAVRRVAAETLKELGGIDVVITNAGRALLGWAHEMPDSFFDEEVQVNYMGQVNVVRAFLPTLLAQKHGNLCLVSSMLGFMGSFGYAAYCGTKYAVAGFAEALRHELKPQGVKVTLLFTPTIKTPGLEEENKLKPKSVWLYESENAFTVVLEPQKVAAVMLEAVAKGRFELTVGFLNRVVWFMFRHFPGFSRWMSDDEAQKAVKKAAARA